MNKKMIGLSALAVLSLAACNKNVENGVEPHGNTQAGLVVTVKGGSSLRADDYSATAIGEHQVDADGKVEESKVSSLYVLMGKDQRTFEFSEDGVNYATTPDKFFTPISAGLTKYSATGTKSYKAGPWLVAAGTGKKMAVIVNGTSPFNAYEITAEDADKAYGQDGKASDPAKYTEALNSQLKSLSTDGTFVMSSVLQTKDITDDVSKSDVSTALAAATTDGKNEVKNVFHFDLERLVCKGIVTKGANLQATAKIEDGTGTIDTSTLKYAAINGATKIYVLATKAGDRVMTQEGDGKTAPTTPGVLGKYKGYTSAIDGSTVAPTSADAETQNLVRLGNIGISALTGGTSGYAPIAVSVDAAKDGGVAANNGVYFLENSTSKDIADRGDKLTSYGTSSSNNQAGYYRFAYAKVYATVTPANLYYYDETKKQVLLGTSDEAKTHGFADGTFYQGLSGLLYATPKAAKENKEEKVFIYYKGRCFYRALWNREYKTADMAQTSYASTRRNNIYVININSFKKLGMPFDPSDPNDPNLPAPGATIIGGNTGDNSNGNAEVPPVLTAGPDSPSSIGVNKEGGVDEDAVKKDDPRIDKKETYMAVTATVLKWNVVTRGVDLE